MSSLKLKGGISIVGRPTQRHETHRPPSTATPLRSDSKCNRRSNLVVKSTSTSRTPSKDKSSPPPGSSEAELPPGPWNLPFIGSLHHLATALPHRALHDLAQSHGPVMRLQAGEIDLVVVTSREASQEVMKTQDVNFAFRPEMMAPKIVCYGCTDIAFSSYGQYWRQLRRICVTELLSAKRVKTFASVRLEEVQSLLKDLSNADPQTPVNLSARLAALTNTVVSRATFGRRWEHETRFLSVLKEAMELTSGFSIADLFPSLEFLDIGMRMRLERIHGDLDEILSEIVEEHRIKRERKDFKADEATEDLIDVLLKAKEQGDLEVPITFDNIKAVILDLFTGGTETSASIIEWTISELIKNPKELAKAQEEVRNAMKGKTKIDESVLNELSYLKLAIKETLRLHPPVPLLVPRVAHETCQILGYKIPAGTRVIINAWALGREPKYWDEPEKFKPARFESNQVDYKGSNFEFVPFGAGRRICPGIGFGLAIVELALAHILAYFDLKLPDGMQVQDLDMTETFGASAVRKEQLFVTPIPRFPLPKV